MSLILNQTFLSKDVLRTIHEERHVWYLLFNFEWSKVIIPIIHELHFYEHLT